MAPYLAYEMELRGRDSWGCTNGVDAIRHLGPISHSWHRTHDAWQDWSMGIFHTRAASTGAVILENQHPFVVDSADGTRRYTGIHNGIVSNHVDLNKRHGRTFDCDSPHIFMALAGYSPTNEIAGYGNVAWYETDLTAPDPRPELHFVRFNGDNLHIIRAKSGEIIFASTHDAIIRAARWSDVELENPFQIQGDTEYIIGTSMEHPHVSTLLRGDRRPFGTRGWSGTTTPIPNYGCHNGGRSTPGTHGYEHYKTPSRNISLIGATDRKNNLCSIMQCEEKVTPSRHKALICTKHLQELLASTQLNTKLLTMRGGESGGGGPVVPPLTTPPFAV